MSVGASPVVDAMPGNPPGLMEIHFEDNFSDRREEELREKIAFQKSISEVARTQLYGAVRTH
jgi:hypothetical protein